MVRYTQSKNINFVVSVRKFAVISFLLFFSLFVLFFVLSIYFYIQVGVLRGQTYSVERVSKQFEDLLSEKQGYTESLREINDFQANLDLINSHVGSSLGVRNLLVILEENFIEGVVYTSIECSGRSGKIVLNFVAESEGVASSMIGILEAEQSFSNVALLKRTQSDRFGYRHAYEVELKI